MQVDRAIPEPEELSFFDRSMLASRLREKLIEHDLNENGQEFSNCLRFINKTAVLHFTNMIEELVAASRRRSVSNCI